MNMKLLPLVVACGILLVSCNKEDTPESFVNEDASTFKEIGSLGIGGVGAAEISAYDVSTQRLFVVNNSASNKIDVLDIKNPAIPVLIHTISLAPYAGAVNSLAVSNGKLAAAIEALNKQDNGKVVIFNTADYSEVKVITVGALPDMITYTNDGKYILAANEGEPGDDYTNDPAGTVSIIDVSTYTATTINFGAFTSQVATLKSGGLRVFGVDNDFVKDMEPEYITVSGDSKTAWVTLQENNAIAKIDIMSKTVSNIFPLGFKDYNITENSMELSDKDNTVAFGKWRVKGMYQPDAIAILETGGVPYLFTANEGDAREYSGFAEVKRVGKLNLDAMAFPDAATLQLDEQLGRLNITTTLGDTDGDGDYDELYSFGARSFSIWNGNTGAQVFDSKNELDVKAQAMGLYDNGRSDDKGSEPEGITIGMVGNKKIAFVALERADAVAIYDVTNPVSPVFLQMIKCGDAPEGVLFISAKDSPTQKSLLVVSSENDGFVKIFMPDVF
jgi:hypothetical protein